MTPAQFDVMLGQLAVLEQQVQSAIRTLALMRPQPIEDHRKSPERVRKTFGRSHNVPLDPDEVAAQATAPAAREGYIYPEAQGAIGHATSGKADDSGAS